MSSDRPEPTNWRKARASWGENKCVEVGRTIDGAAVRHSQHPDGERLEFSARAWRAFTDGLHRGDYDLG
ncbi:DUF397 domain-containing protein [Saccharopolyspora griseoalba]|uniref:DUF397 domain-containing protein n=1 Tax=Saccharopolyspora griseoalba TaxID=1431848 RepID=A0ABW2LTE2_9PSEU